MGLIFDTDGNLTRRKATDAAPQTDSIEKSPAPPLQSSPRIGERRKQFRARMNVNVRLRPAEARDGEFEEVLTTLNVSRSGFYSITMSRHYFVKMRLLAVLPFSSAHDVATMEE